MGWAVFILTFPLLFFIATWVLVAAVHRVYQRLRKSPECARPGIAVASDIRLARRLRAATEQAVMYPVSRQTERLWLRRN